MSLGHRDLQRACLTRDGVRGAADSPAHYLIPATGSAAPSYCMDASAMHLQRHGCPIDAVRLGAGEASVTEVRFRCVMPPWRGAGASRPTWADREGPIPRRTTAGTHDQAAL